MYCVGLFAALLPLIGTVWARYAAEDVGSLGQVKDTEIPSDYKCVYKGVTYNEGDELPTHDICYHCECREGFTVPNRLMCAQIHCPRRKEFQGCLPIHKEDKCCPVDYDCSARDAKLSQQVQASCHECDQRYFRHYEAKHCKPVIEDGCECPVRFDCSDSQTAEVNNTVCQYKGNTYAQGEDIPTSNPCEICSCRKNYFSDDAILNCIPIECGSMFMRLREGCYDVYEEGKCCPSSQKCDGAETNGTAEVVEPTCEFEGKTYHLGQRMYSEEDPCLICLCDEHFHGPNSNSCRIHECSLEREQANLESGCIPIYHEKTCCPIEFYCPTGNEVVTPHLSHATVNQSDSLNQCAFAGEYHNTGAEMDIHHPTNCVTCKCTTPPDFTCVHKVCPRPPNDDYDNCQSVFLPGECCPKYECAQLSAPTKMCDPVRCEGDCVEVTVPHGCPMCQCQSLLCSPPRCQPDCEVNYDVAPGTCPTCKCPLDSTSSRLARAMCDPVKCSPQCFEGISSEGCPMCVCSPVCSPPKCDEGCHVQTDFSEGECPGCVCTDFDGVEPATRVECAPVKCPPMCREVMGDTECPMCSCEPMCSPPKCMPGCHMETPPYSGPCPGCVCGDQEKLTAIQCSPVQCQPGCRKVFVPNGCPMCQCTNILCSPPKCDEGCTVETEFPDGGCPGCKCPPSYPLTRPMCGPVKCGPQCHEGISPQGCPMCVCGPLCSPPKCQDGCKIQTDVPNGQCPGCTCDSDDESHGLSYVVQCSPVMCPSFCRKSIGDSGCETCVCDPMCSPPKCGPGCRVETIPSSGPCPGCVCETAQNPFVQCAPVKCDPGCQQRTDFSSSPCPYCVCDSDHDENDDSDGRIQPLIRCSMPKCQPGCYPKLTPPAPCPTCQCEESRIPQTIQCDPPKCDPGCYAKLVPPGPCPSCECEDQSRIQPIIQCSPPKCDPGCYAKLVPPGPCPSCQCEGESRIPLTIQCSPPKCDPGCYPKLVPPGPCPSCQCDQVQQPHRIMCSPPKCDPGCYPKLVPPGPCPTCQCEEQSRIPPRIMCSPPKCDPGCYPKLVPPGPCPTCQCEEQSRIPQTIQCSPPKCDPGCFPKLTPPHPCPACDCGDMDGPNPSLDMVQCAPVRCSPGCYMENDSSPPGCPRCVCDGRNYRSLDRIQCSPPRCDYGCYPKVVPPGRCASCFCREGGRVGGLECPQMTCQLPCRRVSLTPNSCPMCICDNFPVCTMPICAPECHTEESSSSGCKECVCPEGVTNTTLTPPDCGPVECGFRCREATDQYGCPACACDPVCSMPRCRPGCRPKLDQSRGPCPVCSC